MPKFCKYCGKPLKEGARFCTGCGHPVAQAPKAPAPRAQAPVTPPPAPVYQQPPMQPQFQQPQYQQPSYYPAPKRGGGGKAVLIILLLLILGGAGFALWKYGDVLFGDGHGGTTVDGSAPLIVLRAEESRVTPEEPSVKLCDVLIDVPPQILKEGGSRVSVSVLGETVDNEGIRSDHYEIEMDTHEPFRVPVEVTFPCEIAPNTDVVVEHYDAKRKEWEQLMSFVDEKEKTVSACFDSFCEVKVSYLPVGKDPRIYYALPVNPAKPFVREIGISRNYWSILQRIHPDQYGPEIIKFIDDPENYAIDTPKLDPNMDLDAVYSAYSSANTLWTFCDPLINMGRESLPFVSKKPIVQFMIDHSEKLGNAMNAVPFVMLSAQLAYDLEKQSHDVSGESNKTTAANLYKNLLTGSGTIHSVVTGYSHIGFTMAFFGVSVFGWELDYFIDAAKAEQAANVTKVFDAYYNKEAPFDENYWCDVFEQAYWNNDQHADAAMRDIKKAVDDYCNQFWQRLNDPFDTDIWFVIDDAGYRKVFENPAPELRRSLTEQQKQKVWKLIETRSMKHIRRFLIVRLQEKAKKQLAEVCNDYNRQLTFSIREQVEGDGAARYPGYTVCLGLDGKPFTGWHYTIPKGNETRVGWSTELPCTVYGYMLMGMPNRVMLYKNEADFRSGKAPDVEKLLTPKYKGDGRTEVVFITEGEDDDTEVEEAEDEVEGPDSFTGYEWEYRQDNEIGGYDAFVSDSAVKEAMNDALRKMIIHLDKKGDFSAASSGAFADSKQSGGDSSQNWNISANVSLSGHYNQRKGEGSFKMEATISYHHKYLDSFSGNDEYTLTLTHYVKDGRIVASASGDLSMRGESTGKQTGSNTHTKTGHQQDKDYTERLDKELGGTITLLFIANN